MVCTETDRKQFRQGEETDIEIRLVGDSIVRGQLTEFCARKADVRKRYCIPGARVDDVSAAVETVSHGAGANTLYLIHVGTNDVHSTRTEDLLAKYRRAIRRYKVKSNNVIVSGILPRVGTYTDFNDKANNVNTELKEICINEGVAFTNAWHHFYEKPHLFRGDGLHLNPVGSARLGRLLNDAVVYHSKN